MVYDPIEDTKLFVKAKFIGHPHHSFNDWSIMYNHSILVNDISGDLAKTISCDKLVVSIGSLLHDIGKAHPGDEIALHKKHNEFSILEAEPQIQKLDLSLGQEKLLKNILSEKGDSVELKIIKDADALAFYKDKRLHSLFLEWALKNHLKHSIQVKIDKFDKLNFHHSKKIGQRWFEQMKTEWEKSFQLI
jgi:putative nucleotidyltransferase with HDIG domain